jgi:hypothetical protein
VFFIIARKGTSINPGEKVQNVNGVTEFAQLQGMLPMKCLPIPGKKVNTVFVYHAINGAHNEIY